MGAEGGTQVKICGLTREQGYVLASVAADLRVAEAVTLATENAAATADTRNVPPSLAIAFARISSSRCRPCMAAARQA